MGTKFFFLVKSYTYGDLAPSWTAKEGGRLGPVRTALIPKIGTAMDALVSTILHLRRGSRQSWPAVIVVLLAAGVLLHAAMPLGPVGYGILIGLTLVGMAIGAWQRASLVEQSWRPDLLVGCLLAIAAFGVVHEGGGIEGDDIARPASFLFDRDGHVV